MPFKKPRTEEVRMSARASVDPKDLVDALAGVEVPSETKDIPIPFTGYKTISGEPIDKGTEIRIFNRAQRFDTVDGSTSHIAVPKKTGKEMATKLEMLDAAAGMIRQQALEIPEGLEGEALLQALETKLADFTTHFDAKWKGKMFGNEDPEKEADLECLAKLQGRVSREQAQIQRHNFVLRRTQDRVEDVARIDQVELEQMRADLISAQGKLLEELNTTPISEVDDRHQIHEQMRRLGKLLKSGNEQSLRTWWDEHAVPSEEMISGEESEFSKF